MNYESLNHLLYHSIPQRISLYKLTIQYIALTDERGCKKEIVVSRVAGREHLPPYVRTECGRLVMLCSELSIDRSMFLPTIKRSTRPNSRFIISLFFGNVFTIINYLTSFFNGEATIDDRAFIIGSNSSSSSIYISLQTWWMLNAAFHSLPIDNSHLHSLGVRGFEKENDDGSTTSIKPSVVNRYASKHRIRILADC